MIAQIIGSIILGAIVGAGGRAILPGAQNIGLVKTVLLGIVANLLVGLVLGAAVNPWVGIIVGALVAAGLLWLAVRQGFLTA